MAGYYEIYTYNNGAPVQATVQFYRRGTAVTSPSTASVGYTTAVTLYVVSSANLTVSQNLRLVDLSTGAVSGEVLRVDSVPGPTSIKVKSVSSGSTVTVKSGNRLISVAGQPVLWSDPACQAPLTSPSTSDSANGFLGGYLQGAGARFDVIVSGSGLTTTLYEDQAHKWTSGMLNVLDYEDVQHAFDDSTPGARLYFPPGTYPAPQGAWVVNKRLEIFGQFGGDFNGPTTKLVPYQDGSPTAYGKDVFIFREGSDGSYVHDLYVDQQTPARAPSDSTGIRVAPSASGKQIIGLRFERVYARGFGRGIYLDGDSDRAIEHVQVTDCVCDGNRVAGLHAVWANDTMVVGGHYGGCYNYGIWADHGSMFLNYPGVEGNVTLNSSYFAGLLFPNLIAQAQPTDAQAYLSNLDTFVALGVYFEGFARKETNPTTAQDELITARALRVRNCAGGLVDGCIFTGAIPDASAQTISQQTGVVIESTTGQTCHGIQVGINSFKGCTIPVRIVGGHTETGCTVLAPGMVLGPRLDGAHNVAMDDLAPAATTGTTDAAVGNLAFFSTGDSTLLDAPSARYPSNFALGLTLPRLSAASLSEISSPPEGLLVHQGDGSTPGPRYWNGTAWKRLLLA